MRAFSLVLVGVVATGSSGCDNGIAPGTDGPADLSMIELQDMPVPDDARRFVTASQFDVDLANAICTHFMMCGALDAADFNDCVTMYTAAEPGDRDSEILKGRMSINEAQCLPAITGARCDGQGYGYVYGSRCAQFLFVAMQQSDGVSACITDVECINGYCDQALNDGGVATAEGCPGVCRPFKTLTAACDPFDPFACDFNVATCDGVTSTCVAKKNAADPCADSSECKAGLYCSQVLPRRCTAPGAEAQLSQPCDPEQAVATDTASCALGLYCQWNAIASTGTCRAKVTRGNNCNAGDVFSPASDNPCEDGTRCFKVGVAPQTTCEPLGSADQPCDPTAFSSCKETLYCDASAKLCKHLLPNNSPCLPTQCLSGKAFGVDTCIGATCVGYKSFNNACVATVEDSVCATGYCDGVTMKCANFCQ